MPPPASDGPFLFGVLAFRNGLITREVLLQALASRSADLREDLRQRGAVSAGMTALLDSLVQEQLRRHGGDLAGCLAALGVLDDLRPHLDGRLVSSIPATLATLTRNPVANEPLIGTTLALDARDSENAAGDPVSTITPDHSDAARADGPLASRAAAARRCFRTLRLLGRGGLGEVFVARDEELQREVALKEIQARHLGNAESRDRFLLEAEITGRLEHPGIVPVYGLGTYPDGRPFYAMRFIKGESLQEAIAHFHGAKAERRERERVLELRQLLTRFVALCNAIAYAHSRGVLHRDLKPANVMLGEFGETLVVDWGLAKRLGISEACPATDATVGEELGATTSGDSSFTQMGQVVGTPAYMSPEQAAGKLDALGPPSDVYSLGATLYALLTGKAPFQERDVRAVLRAVQEGTFPKPRAVLATVPAALEAVCLKAMARDASKRYPDPRALAADVEHWLADEPTTVYREPWSKRLGRRVRRHKTAVAALVALLLTATVGLGIGAVLLEQADNRTIKALRQEEEANRKEEQARRERAVAQIENLRTARSEAVPAILEALAPFRDEVEPRLLELWRTPDVTPQDRSKRMRVGLALLAWQPDTVKEPLVSWMLEVENPRELELTRDLLAPYGPELKDRLWSLAADRETAAAVRFNALVALARFDPHGPLWPDFAPRVLAPWLRADPLYVGHLTRALSPIRSHLLQPLTAVAVGRSPSLDDKRFEATAVLAVYAEHQPEILFNLLAEADERQFAILLPKVRAQGARREERLRTEALRWPRWYQCEDASTAARRANMALALMRLGRSDVVWPLLQHRPGPTLRSYLTVRMASRGVPARLLVERLETTPELSERRALISALGEYDDEHLAPELRRRLTPLLVGWYRDHPDPGLHAVTGWLLRHDKEGPQPRKLDWGGADDLARIDAELRGKATAGGRRWSINGLGMTEVYFGPAEFMTGMPGRQGYHRHRFEHGFAMADANVTVRQFQAFLKANPQVRYGTIPDECPDLDCPILSVTWFEAAQFCNWLSEQEGLGEDQLCYPSIADIEKCKDGGLTFKPYPNQLQRKGYRLPTFAEFEYACRAGASSARAFGEGNDLLEVFELYSKNAQERSWPVGEKRPNDFGLFDMLGNSRTWCQPSQQFVLSAQPRITTDRAAVAREFNAHVTSPSRGGGYGNMGAILRANGGTTGLANGRFNVMGLRVVRSL